MIILLDTADISAIKPWISTGIIDGVTINPTLLSKVDKPTHVIKEIIELLPHGDIHVEVTETEPEKIYAQAHAIAALNERVIVKIPAHHRYLETIDRLTDDGLAINATLVGSPLQALLLAKLHVAYVSLIIGRVEDTAFDGATFVQTTVNMLQQYDYDTEVLVASVRSVADVLMSAAAGADAITMPPAVLEKVAQHPLTDTGMAQFDRDWRASGKTFL